MKKPKKLPTVQKLKVIADGVFSTYIRLRDKGVCYTCGKYNAGAKTPEEMIKGMQCGHFVSRSHNETRYDEKNNHCQCQGCNIFKYGDLSTYAFKLAEQYGPKILKELEKRKRILRQFTVPELLKIIETYKKKVKKLELNREDI